MNPWSIIQDFGAMLSTWLNEFMPPYLAVIVHAYIGFVFVAITTTLLYGVSIGFVTLF